jgi:cell division protein FtsN
MPPEKDNFTPTSRELTVKENKAKQERGKELEASKQDKELWEYLVNKKELQPPTRKPSPKPQAKKEKLIVKAPKAAAPESEKPEKSSAVPEKPSPASEKPKSSAVLAKVSPKPSPDSKTPYFTIQVGSFKNQDNAGALAAKLNKKGYLLARVVEAEIEGRGTWYRVRVGRFVIREDADQLAKILREKEKLATAVMREK